MKTIVVFSLHIYADAVMGACGGRACLPIVPSVRRCYNGHMRTLFAKLRAAMAIICVCMLLLVGCAAPQTVVVVSTPPQTAAPPDPETAAAVADPSPKAEQPEPTSEPAGMVLVRDGDTLERDIIPQLCTVFGMEEDAVKEALSQAESRLIGEYTEGFRRMEGIIVPGEYAVTDEPLADYIALWVQQAQARFENVAAACGQKNGLEPHEQLTLASIVEWECIGGEYEREAAAAFLNRLDDGAKLRSCATTEYALGYQRPYLTSDDIGIDDPYNTYQVKGLPPGPICTVDDDSLAAGISPAVDEDIYYFFYDYVPDTMQFFSDYDEFKAAANESIRLLEQTFDFGKYDVVDKRAVFGG